MRAIVKLAMQYAALVIMLPLILSYRLLAWLFDEDETLASFSQFLSLLPGRTGSYLRVAFYSVTLARCSRDCYIGFGTLFSHRNTDVGAGVYIGPQCNIGSCRIDEDCLLGSGVHVLSGKRQHALNDLETPVRDQGGEFEKIAIGCDTWIGNGAILMAGTGKHCVIGAGAVLTNPIDDFEIAGGNPARVIASRKPASGS
ncbi:MAG: acyltransferase [Granulosicoccus sp.]